jgi:enoyl-CoA hydratase/carnithine racemase
MSAEHLLVEVQDDILIVPLNRPEKLNALSHAMMDGIEAAVHRLRDTPALKVMLIRANGRYFSAGVDLKEVMATQVPMPVGSAVREVHRIRNLNMHRIYDEMEHVEKPIVAAHHAPCVGGGLEMSLSCDFRLAAKSAHYALPENKQGALPASNGVSRLTRICGTHWARWMVMAGQIVDADEARMMGLVHKVYPDEVFQAEVLKFCRFLASQDTEAMGAAKLAIEMCRDVGLDQARNVERMANSALMLGPKWAQQMDTYVSSIGGKSKPSDA